MTPVFIILLVLLTVSIVLVRARQATQLKFIRNYPFHPGIKQKLRRKHPTLSDADIDLVFQGLRDYFLICRKAKRKMVSMPSQAVDDAWHEFILFTLIYERFCSKSLGRFLHHTPAEAMRTPTAAQEGIKRAWRLACVYEGIDRKAPTRLPLIFAIDAMLNIENGFMYRLDCRDSHSPAFGSGYCATHIGCAAGCAGGSDASSDGGDSGDSSGCGGGGCGGGCGGGD
ncbi:MAG: glycine-rich domain-containing protein [Gammaproteobacteria bacterium]